MENELEPVPTNFHDLAFSKYNLAFRSYGGVVEAEMTKSKRPTHRAMLALGRLRFISKTAECIRLVVMEATNERTACIDFDMFGEYVMATNVTVLASNAKILQRSEDDDGKYLITWLFRKHSERQDSYNSRLGKDSQGSARFASYVIRPYL